MEPERPLDGDEVQETFAAFGSADDVSAERGAAAPPRPGRRSKLGTTRHDAPRDPTTGACVDEDTEVPADAEGNLFGKYRLIRKLGDGGMGTVWLVEHVTLKREAALKLIRSELLSDDSRRRFEREGVIQAKLGRHPNAVVVYDAGFEGSFAYIEMEYLNGETLKDRLTAGQPLPLADVRWILAELCAVLSEAHGLSVVHRDIKPNNIMIVPDPSAARGERVKLLDFGIAKLVKEVGLESFTLTQQGQGYLGTLPYCSPEQLGLSLTGEGDAKIDHLSDIYSLGVMLYEMLAGTRPFTGTMTQLIHDHGFTPPPSFAAKAPRAQVPPAVEKVVVRCLEKDPALRPQSARELIDAFTDALGESNVVLEPKDRAGKRSKPDAPTPARPFLARLSDKRLLIGLAVVAGLAGLVISVAAFGGKKNHEPTAGGDGVTPLLPPPIPPEALAWLEEHRLTDAESGGRLPNGWPTKVRRTDRPTQSLALHGSFYLPAGYEADTPSGESVEGLPKVLIREEDSTRFLLIEGTGDEGFTMGAFNDSDFEDEEKPAHAVRLSSFYIQETEVTIGAFARYCTAVLGDDDPAANEFRGEWEDLARVAKIQEKGLRDHPATGVSHALATRYARDHGGVLPSEAQWEFAARSRGDQRLYVWGNSPEGLTPPASKANVNNARELSSDVFQAWQEDRTDQGVLGLAGNVREWCRDVWDSYPVKVDERDPCVAPRDGVKDPAYVIRGGSYRTDGCTARVTWRGPLPGAAYKAKDDVGFPDVGFRVVLEVLRCEPLARSSARRTSGSAEPRP